MQKASAPRPPRLAIATLPGLDHFVPDLARGLAGNGGREVRVHAIRSPADVAELLAWTDRPGDAVWLEFCWPPFPAILAATDFAHRRVIVRVHRIEAYETDHVARTDWSRVHDLIVVSHDMARVVREVRPDIEQQVRLHVVHNGVDLSRIVPREDFDRHRIGWCGNLIARKNPSLALQILHRLREEDAGYVLHVAAGSADRLTTESFCHQVRALGLDDAVQFDGRIAAADMPAWHARNGVLLSTSLHESFGYAIAEAAAAGCEVVALDHAGADEFWPADMRFVAIDDAAARIRAARADRWRWLIAERLSLSRQVAAVTALLDEAPADRPAGGAWSARYWDGRYRAGGHSGAGSQGRLAAFKAETINRIVAEHGIRTVLELGCGDGQQLALSRYPAYVGVDVSATAIGLCRERFRNDGSKRFVLSGEDVPEPADLVLSLDVVFHLVEDEVFDRYMRDLFGSARRLVLVYASDREERTADPHVRHRCFSAWIERHAAQWRRLLRVPNPYPFDPENPGQTSFADVHLFGRADLPCEEDTIVAPA